MTVLQVGSEQFSAVSDVISVGRTRKTKVSTTVWVTLSAEKWLVYFYRASRMNERLFPLETQNPHCQLFKCDDIIAHLGDYVDKELPLEQRAAIDNHLDDCSACASFYASYKHVVDSAAQLREEEKPLPIGVQNRLRKALNDRLGINLPLIA